ncbi:MAG: electron transfer flavoprotein subunit beta/FixA family protein [Chloroherpetonaceae bacterium]|nr:electron transfer flavoprotein subunit beta/FixA family protein [Chloroherpetonaceae bacterium]MCS7212017.1 electron transfer flavoprotein subunit beta/FixA family protein [Chloroherpetonaceae bacterium]MDW8020721.1 electron transfer flavoprotein subunit beta/FixA family protein [Chloroherpetonaceae bacterium]
MNFAVCLNQVPDTSTRVKIASDQQQIDSTGVNFVINPYDEFALEEALKLREKFGGTVVLFSVGGDDFQANIRKAFAMGADKAVLIKSAVKDSFGVASVLAEAIKRHFGGLPDLILLGKESTDFNDAQVGPMLAELLELPAVTVAVSMQTDGKTAIIEREIEGGKEIVEVAFPFVMTAQKGLNTPRVANMKGIMEAKKKPIETVEIAPPESSRVRLIRLEKPAEKQPGKILSSPAELVEKLHREANVV